MFQPIGLDCLVIEPRTVACLPFAPTSHTEFGLAPTCHVVTSLLQFYHGGTVEAALPPFFLGNFDEKFGRRVARTFLRCMHLEIAKTADPGTTFFALGNLAAIL